MSKKLDKCAKNVIAIIIGAFISISNPQALADDDEKPSLEFLEYLGEWETKDGEWIDPMQLKKLDESALESQSLKVNEDRSHD